MNLRYTESVRLQGMYSQQGMLQKVRSRQDSIVLQEQHKAEGQLPLQGSRFLLRRCKEFVQFDYKYYQPCRQLLRLHPRDSNSLESCKEFVQFEYRYYQPCSYRK